MDKEKILDISWKTLFKVFALIIFIYIFYQIKDILVWFVFALVISILAEPSVNFLQKLRLPRSISVFLVYIGVFGFFIFLIYSIAPAFITEIQQFSRFLPQYFEEVAPFLKGLGIQALQDVETFVVLTKITLEKTTSNILSILFVIFGGIFASVFILTISMFLSLEDKGIEKVIIMFFPKKYNNYLLSLWKRVQKKVTGWFMTRILSCLFVGLATYITLLIFRAPYPFSFGLIAGVFNFIPTIGPLVTGILLFIIIAIGGLFKAIFVVLAFALIQQIEASVLIPLLSKKFIGLSPVLVLVSLAIGGILWGFLGAILAVPLAGILMEFLGDFVKRKREEEQVESVIL